MGSDHVVSWPPSDFASSHQDNIWSLKTGFTSRVEMHLPVLLEGVHRGDLTLERAGRRWPAPSRRGSSALAPRKGCIEVGADADLVLVDLDRTVRVSNDQVLTRSGWTVLDGHTIHGWPVATFLRGKQIARWEDGAPGPEYLGDSDGRYLRREAGPAPAPAATAGVGAG